MDKDEKINSLCDMLIETLNNNAEKLDAKDISHFMASELIDLIELTVECDLQKTVTKKTLSLITLPIGAKLIIRKYFGLAY